MAKKKSAKKPAKKAAKPVKKAAKKAAPKKAAKPAKKAKKMKKAGRNDPCPCGAINSNTGNVYKYKQCGMINAIHHKV